MATVLQMATGTTGMPAWIAMTRPPFLNGCTTPLSDRVPSGNSSTDLGEGGREEGRVRGGGFIHEDKYGIVNSPKPFTAARRSSCVCVCDI